MEYGSEDFSVIVPSYLLDDDVLSGSLAVQNDEEGEEFTSLGESPEIDTSSGYRVILANTGDSNIDYSTILSSIDSHLEVIESNVTEIRDNTYRLYYFIGGLYVAFAIVLAIKFLKQFF